MSPIEVLFCRENLAGLGSEALERLQAREFPELRIQVVKCIIACSECASSYIARVNGELLVAETAAGLVAAIEQTMEQIRLA